MEKKIIQTIRDGFSPEKNTEQALKSLSNSVEILADDLYAKDTHFIFELIQNAEDNDYSRKDPSLKFSLSEIDLYGNGKKLGLLVENNEDGFQMGHVKAICAVGVSTKDKKKGYIGEKGIGFKSVFRVTSCPSIFSNGYRFSLPQKDESTNLGYIVPYWQKEFPKRLDHQKTNIYLPLDQPDFPKEKIVESLQDIAPETIIFLDKLKTIEIEVNLEEHYEIIIEKDASKFPIVELIYLKRNTEKEVIEKKLFWVASKEYTKPAEIFHEKRLNVDSRKVSVAIPIEGGGNGKLFAYLPVWENTGIPFLINADFLLVSSREGIKSKEPWNLWLRDCISEVYSEALLGCLKSRDLTFKQRINAYSSIPMNTHEDFLEPIIQDIKQILKKTACVFTEPNRELLAPANTRFVTRDFRELLNDSDFPDALNGEIKLVCKELEPFNKEVKSIGVTVLKSKEVCECLCEYSWLISKSDDWFLNLYRFLEKRKMANEAFDSIRILKVKSPTKTECFLSCDSDQPIYFECDDETKHVIDNIPNWLKEIVPIAFLDRAFFTNLCNQKDCEQIQSWMTTQLNVYDFSTTNYCVDILNVITDKYETLSPKQIADVANFLVVHAADEFNWKNLPIILNNGDKIVLSDVDDRIIVVPESYNEHTGWQNIWKTEEDREGYFILSDEYSNNTVKQLLEYCKDKIYEYPDPTRVSSVDSGYTNYERECIDKTPYYSRGYKISNWRSPDVIQKEQVEDIKTANSLIALLLKKTISKYLHLIVHYFYYSSQTSYDYSEFVYHLKKCKWVPTTKGFVRPAQAFLPRNEIIEIFGDTVPYYQGELLDDHSLYVLGIKKELILSELIAVLIDYSGESSVSLDMLQRVYSELDARAKINDSNKTKLIDEFQKNDLIYIPDKNNFGKWCSIDDVLWEDAENILGKDIIYIEKYYPELKNFFVEILQIKEEADPESFARRWLKIQENPIEDAKVLKEIMEDIYRELLPIAKQSEILRPEWWPDFINEVKVLTQGSTFEPPWNIVVPDDGELKAIFNKSDIDFAWRPEKDSFNQWASFYDALSIPRISESVSTELSDATEITIKTSNEFITEAVIFMMAAWLRERDINYYKSLIEEDVFQELLGLREATTSEAISVIFSLETGWIYDAVEEKYPVYWGRDTGILILDENTPKNELKRKISNTIAKSVMNNRAYKDLATWIEVTLGANKVDRIQDAGWSVPKEVKQLIKTKDNEKKDSKIKAEDTVRGTSGARLKKNEREENPQKPETDSNNNRESQKNSNSNSTKTDQGSIDSQDNFKERHKKKTEKEYEQENLVDNDEEESSENNFESKTDSKIFDKILDKMNDAFNKVGETFVREEYEDLDYYNDGNVKNPSGRREKSTNEHSQRFGNEPNEDERRKETTRSILEQADPATRAYLLNLYGGKCQICGRTFPQRNGKPFFVVGHIVERKYARFVDNHANALSFCPLHFAQWRHGSIKTDNIFDQILSQKTKKEGGKTDPKLLINLCGADCSINFKEKHMVDLQSLIDFLTDGDSSQ